MKEPEKKLCPLLVMAKAISLQISGRCMGKACAWYRERLQKDDQGKWKSAGLCCIAELKR